MQKSRERSKNEQGNEFSLQLGSSWRYPLLGNQVRSTFLILERLRTDGLLDRHYIALETPCKMYS